MPKSTARERQRGLIGRRSARHGHSVALGYLTELTHRRPRVWIRDVERLHELLQQHGEVALRGAFERGLAKGLFGAEYVAHSLHSPAPTPATQTELPL